LGASGEATIFSGAAGQISRALSSFSGYQAYSIATSRIWSHFACLDKFHAKQRDSRYSETCNNRNGGLAGVSPIPFVMAVALSAIIAFVTPVGVPSTALIYSTSVFQEAS